MTIIVTCPDTVFGDLIRTFSNYVDALNWVQACLSNDLKCIVESK